ncbi:MAG: hypothetical protein P8170_23645, partial [Gemmatimonadota bacterium]
MKRMKRWLPLTIVALAVAACQDGNESMTGPEASDLVPSFTHTGVESCVGSPCDGRFGGTHGFYFLPSLVSNPNVTDPLVTGLAPFLRVEAVVIDCP